MMLFLAFIPTFLLGFSSQHVIQASRFSSPPAVGKFRAAVYEHELVLPSDCLNKVCSREEAIGLMERNLEILEEQIVEASSQGAQIILLPEDGIHGYGHISRQTLTPFLEYVPPVADGSVPCYEDGVDDAYVSSRLSCLALENNIWIAAAYGSVVPGCEHCSHGGECMFNTLVVFSSNGSIAGVYHKYNLWTSELEQYDIDPEGPSLVTVETEFGLVGLSICADLMWQSPIVDLVTEYDIDSLLLPLSWWDLFPHQLAHSNEDAWARGLQINVLSANTHSSAGWSTGSGIYSSNGHVAYRHDLTPTAKGALLIGDLDIKPDKSNVSWSEYANANVDSYPTSPDMFQEVVYDDLYNFVPLTNDMTQAKVCADDGHFCCLAEFEAEFNHHTVFSLGAFRGNHFKDGSVAGHWKMEMCTLIKCDPKHSAHTCTQDQSWDYNFLSTSDTIFKQLSLSATFSPGAGVYPEVLFDEVTLLPDMVSISEDGVLFLADNVSTPLVSMSLFGRVYEEDPDYPEQFCPV